MKIIEKKRGSDVLKRMEICSKRKMFLEHIARRYGITDTNFSTICCHNVLRESFFLSHPSLKSCKQEKWRNRWRIVCEMLGLNENEGCAFCSSGYRPS